MAEAVQNKIPPDARCYLSNALSVDRALQPGFGDADKQGRRDYCDFSARRSENIFVGEIAGCSEKTNRSVVA